MITLPMFYDRIASLPDGGNLTSDNRLKRGYVYSLIHSASAKAKQNQFLRTKKIHPSWVVQFYPEWIPDAQFDPCVKRFVMPQVIALDSRMIGVNFVGGIKGTTAFDVVVGRAKYVSWQSDPIAKTSKNTLILENGVAELHGDAKNFFMDIVIFDPTENPAYNIEKDPYPIEAGLIPDVEAIILQTNLNIITKSFWDKKPDAVDDSAITK